MADEQDPLRMGGPVNRGVGVAFDPTKATTTMTTGAVGGAGETVVPWVITGSFDALPENVRGALVGYNPDGTARKLKDTSPNDIAAQRTTGYAIDPKSGEIILRQGEGGSARGGVAIDPTITAEQARNMGISSGMNVSYAQPASAGGVSGFFGGVPGSGTLSTSTSTVISSSPSAVTVGYGLGSAGYSERKSAYDLLYQQFAKYGLQALVTPLESLIKEGVPASEFAIRLRETDAYQRRFAANKARVNKGLATLSEAEYIGLEDQYQNIMRQYGMPESYYARGDMGIQQGFEKLIAGDVSAVELENRVSNAYNRVINANPEVVQALKQYYPNITNGDILSYVLDPEKALTDINKKITAAEIGGAAMGAGLGIDVARAEQLGAFGVTKAQAQQGYQTIAEFLPTEMKLSEIYRRQGLGPYNQAVAEAEVFGLSGAAEAAQQRKKYTQLEQAQFSGQAGVGALARERAGSF